MEDLQGDLEEKGFYMSYLCCPGKAPFAQDVYGNRIFINKIYLDIKY